MLINKCETSHGVKQVKGGHRKTLVFLLSLSPLEKANTSNNQI